MLSVLYIPYFSLKKIVAVVDRVWGRVDIMVVRIIGLLSCDGCIAESVDNINTVPREIKIINVM